MALGHYLFIVPSYLSSNPQRGHCHAYGWIWLVFLFFGGFGFLYLTEQASALAEWGDLAEHCFPDVQKTLSPPNSTHSN